MGGDWRIQRTTGHLEHANQALEREGHALPQGGQNWTLAMSVTSGETGDREEQWRWRTVSDICMQATVSDSYS